MNDVIPESGGFLPIQIDDFGYVKHLDRPSSVIHKETRDLYTDRECVSSLCMAKLKLPASEDPLYCEAALLELDAAGGGAHIWMRADQRSLLKPRLERFNGCYGGWSIRILKM